MKNCPYGRKIEKIGWLCTAAAAVIIAAHTLTGCAGISGSLQPDGLHTHSKTCWKGKGCAVRDCTTHYEAERDNE